MRFTIAAGILASTLPSKLQNSGFADAREYKRELWKSLAQPTQSVLGANVQQAVAARRLGRRKTGGLLKNLGTKIANAGPSKSICDPDVGLLACGFGHYCESSQESPLGGVCVPIPESMQRELQTNETDASPSASPTAPPVAASTTDSPTASPTNFTAIASGPGVYCDPDSPFYGRLECDCEQWSAQNQTGTIECKLVPAACFPECEDTCYSVNFTYYTDGIKSSAYTYCYDFYKPFEQTFCFGYANDRTCAVSLDGEKCNSCYTSYQLNCNYGDCYSQPCSNFDCENIGLGTGNSCIDMVAPPVFDDCYRQVAGLYPSCSLCADNVILFPEAEFDLPGYGLFNCSYIADLASYGVLNPQQCTYATVLAGPVCCESGGASAFVCDLCKDSTNVITTCKYHDSAKILRSTINCSLSFSSAVVLLT